MFLSTSLCKFAAGLLAIATLLAAVVLAGGYGLILHAQQQGFTPPPKAATAAKADHAAESTHPDSTDASTPAGVPFVVGERLVYGISLPGFPNAGRLEMEVAERGSFFDHESYLFRAKIESLGAVRSLFGELDNQYTTYVRVNTSLPHRAIVTAQKGQTIIEETIVLDHAKKQASFSDDNTVAIAGETHDLLSLAYALRLNPFAEDAKQRFSLLHGKELIEVDAESRGRERVQSQAGTFMTIPVKFTPRKKYVKYRTRVWFSDDARRLPIMITAQTPFGEARAELASVGVRVRSLPPLAKATPIGDESGTPVAIVLPGASGGASNGGNTDNPASGIPPNRGNGTGENPVKTPKSGGEDVGNGKENTYPFAVGERLTYDIAWGNFASVGKASFEVRRLGMLGSNRVFEFFGEATSNGLARSLITVNDQMSSFAQVDTLVPLRNDLRLREGKRVRQVSATYDWSTRQATLSSGSKTDTPPGTLDLLSLFYAVRAADLKVGMTFSQLFLDANHRLQSVTLRVAKQETINSALGARDALQLDILAPEPARLLLGQVWISNDAKRIPLYLVTRTRFGEIRMTLANAASTR